MPNFFDNHSLFGYSTVLTAPSPASSGTSLTLASGDGTKFAINQNATVWPIGQSPLASNAEVVRITAISTDTLTIVRAQEGSTAQSIVIGMQISNSISPKVFTDVEGAFLPTQINTLITIGHSWQIGGGGGALSGTALPPETMGRQTLIGRLTSMMGIHEDNLENLAIGGSWLTQPHSVLSAALSGWSGVLALVLPENTATVYGQTGFTNYQVGALAGPPALIVHGMINDAGYDVASWPTQGLNAWTNAMTTVISRLRAANVYGSTSPQGTITWDGTIAFGGGGSWTNTSFNTLLTTTGYGAGTGAGASVNTANASTVTITLPALVPASFTVAVCFLGNPTGYTTLNGTIPSSGGSTFTVASTAEFPASGNFVIQVDSEEIVVSYNSATVLNIVTRGVNGTSNVSHANSGQPVITATDTCKVTFSGGVANSTGTLQLSGQGYVGSAIPVIKRIACTQADANQTIVITSAIPANTTGLTNNQVMFDSWWIESVTPPPVIVANSPRATANETGYSSFATAVALNATTSTVVAGFDSSVQIADFDTPFYNRTAQLTGGSINNSVTTITVAANGTGFPTAGGNRITIFAPGDANLEDILIPSGGVSGSYPNYTLTGVTRGYNGTSATGHANGADVTDRLYWATDNIHPNALGHSVLATQAYNAFQTALSQSASAQPYQVAASGGNFQEHRSDPSLALVDNYYLMDNAVGAWITFNATVGTMFMCPIYIPQHCIVTEFGFNLATIGGTGSVVRCGIYLPIADGTPFQLLQDFGTVATASGTGSKTITGLYQQLRPGWYFTAVVAQVGTLPQLSLSYSGFPTTMSLAAPTIQPFGGFSMTGVSGALPTTTSGLTSIAAVVMYLRLRSKPWQ